MHALLVGVAKMLIVNENNIDSFTSSSAARRGEASAAIIWAISSKLLPIIIKAIAMRKIGIL